MTSPSRRRKALPAASNVAGSDDCGPTDDALAQIIAGCQSGERTAQRRLYERYERRLVRLASRMVGEQDAADVVQDVFLLVFRKVHQFSGRAHFDTWLYRLAANQCLAHLRQRKRKQLPGLAVEPTEPSISVEQRAEQRDLLQAALGSLEPELRCVFLLKEDEGLSYQEIAEVLQMAEGTIGSRLNRARRQLRQRLVELGWEP